VTIVRQQPSTPGNSTSNSRLDALDEGVGDSRGRLAQDVQIWPAAVRFRHRRIDDAAIGGQNADAFTFQFAPKRLAEPGEPGFGHGIGRVKLYADQGDARDGRGGSMQRVRVRERKPNAARFAGDQGTFTFDHNDYAPTSLSCVLVSKSLAS
jgi:hypothetical protein